MNNISKYKELFQRGTLVAGYSAEDFERITSVLNAVKDIWLYGFLAVSII